MSLRPEDICIEDIAHHLALINRFNGATKRPISVAQHSVYVARLCWDLSWETQLQALLHDATEAYLGDITKWLKNTPMFAAYRGLEFVTQDIIFKKFNCQIAMLPDAVVEADRLMVRFEASRGMKHALDVPDHLKNKYGLPTEEEKQRVGKWQPWSWKVSEDLFLAKFYAITETKRPAPRTA